MSEIPQIDIDYVAKLARLDMSEEEKSKLGAQLDDILGYFDKLKSVDVEGVEPMAHAHRVTNVWREGDQPEETYSPKSSPIWHLITATIKSLCLRWWNKCLSSSYANSPLNAALS